MEGGSNHRMGLWEKYFPMESVRINPVKTMQLTMLLHGNETRMSKRQQLMMLALVRNVSYGCQTTWD